MSSPQESHSTEILPGEKSPTGTSNPHSTESIPHSRVLNSLLELTDTYCGERQTECGVEHDRGPQLGGVDRRVCMGDNFDAASCLTQAPALLYPSARGNTYQTQTRSIWTNAGNGVGTHNFNYGGYYRPNALNYGEYREGYTADLRSSRGHAEVPGNWRAFSKITKGEQRSSCLKEPRFGAMDIQNSSGKQDESVAKSFLNAHMLTQPYFSMDELCYQPVSYPHLPLEQSYPSLDFTCRFATQMQSSHLGILPPISSQTGIDGMSTPANSSQYLMSAQPTHSQPLPGSSLVLGHVPPQNLSQHQDGLPGYFPQSSFNQLIQEFQSNPLGTFEGIQSRNPRYSFKGLYENENTNLRKLSDICASSNPLNYPLSLSDHEMVSASLKRGRSEYDAFTRIAIGPAMATEGKSYGGKGSPGSCMFHREGGITRSQATCSSEKVSFDMVPNSFGSNEKILSTENEIDVVGDDQKKAPHRMLDTNVMSEQKKRTGLRECECTVCGKKLARASTLKIHMRQHTGDRPFKCSTCAKTFAQAGLLQSHRRTHTGERPFTCSYCRKKFSHSGALKTHVRTHTGERPHKCLVPGCNLAFGDSSTLSKHTRTHTGERPYSCDICGKRFTQSGNMHKHKKSVHNVKNNSSRKETSALEKDKSVERSPVEILLLASESSTARVGNSS